WEPGDDAHAGPGRFPCRPDEFPDQRKARRPEVIPTSRPRPAPDAGVNVGDPAPHSPIPRQPPQHSLPQPPAPPRVALFFSALRIVRPISNRPRSGFARSAMARKARKAFLAVVLLDRSVSEMRHAHFS